MADASKRTNWKRYARLTFDGKSLSRRAKRAESLTTKHAHKFVLGRLASIRNARRRIINWVSIITLLLAAVLLQQMWYRSSYTTLTASDGGTYAEGMLGPIETLNPLYARTSAELSATRLIFSSLFDYDKTGALRNDLAESISVDETGKNYTVKLRPDVLWHDGQRLTAEDVVYTVNVMKSPAARATMYSSWQNVVATADSLDVVRFTLPNEYAAFRHALTFAVLPKHILGSNDAGTLRENQYSQAPVGSGPFSMKLLQSASTAEGQKKVAHLTAWEEYYRGKPKLARFQIHAFANSKDIIEALRMREINAAIDINDHFDEIPKGIEVDTLSLNGGVYAEFNTESPALSNDTVRKALQLGTDVGALRKQIGIRAKSLDTPIILSQLADGVSLPSKPAHNLASAKKLLDKDGWKMNEGVRAKKERKLELRLASVKDRQYKVLAEELARQWKQLGIEVTYVEFDPSASPQSFLQTVLQPRAYDVLINELFIGGDPDVFAYWHSSQANTAGLNFSNYSDPISDDALLTARQRDDIALRSEKYKIFSERWLQNVPAIGLYQSSQLYARTTSTTQLDTTINLPTAADRYHDVLYWSPDKSPVYKTP